MKELSLHILDVVQNSIAADSTLISINITEDLDTDLFIIEIIDNGCGMDEDYAEKIKDPFITRRKSRKVGLGIPLLYAAGKRCEGDLKIESKKGRGTKITAWLRHSHIDRAPLGNMADTIKILIICNPEVDFSYNHKKNEKEFNFDTREIKRILGDVSISEMEVIAWIEEQVREGLKSLNGGADTL